MREIKFRAVISPKTIIYFTLGELVASNPIFHIRELLIPWLRQGNKPDECTGLKDKKGKEIYEGDIFKTETKVMGRIVWSRGKFLAITPQRREDVSYAVNQDVEVIGNIYENPELLKVGDK